MLSTLITSIVAQQRVAELHRVAADHRLARATREVRRPETDTTRMIVRRRRRHLTDAQPVSQ